MFEHGSDKRSMILKAAVKIFSEKGFHKAKVEEIATEAGVGKGTIYEYFGSKKDIFQQIFTEVLEDYLKTVQSEVHLENDPKKAMQRFLRIQLAFVLGHADIANLLLNEINEVDEELKQRVYKIKGKALEIIAKLVEKGISQKMFRQINPLTAAILIEGSINSLFASCFCFNKPLDEQVLEDVEKMIFLGLEK